MHKAFYWILAAAFTAEAPVAADSPPAALSVLIFCEEGASSCEATTFGGTGPYSWTWTRAYKISPDGDAVSTAVPSCGMIPETIFYVSAKVTDATGATGQNRKLVSCEVQPPR